MLKIVFKLVLVEALLLVIVGFITPHQVGGIGGALLNSFEIPTKILNSLSLEYLVPSFAGLIIFLAIVYYILNKKNYTKGNIYIYYLVAFIISIPVFFFLGFAFALAVWMIPGLLPLFIKLITVLS